MTGPTSIVLDADWPDPDVIRVDDDYYLVASSFHRAPGLPVLHSSDLVRWSHLANALPALEPHEHFVVPRHGGGVWAPSLRHHGGVFYIVYPDPDHGIFVLTATDPAGPWSAPHLLVSGVGRIDPCPLWDDDGRAYLVHGWARSRSGISNRLTVVEVDPALRRTLGDAHTVIDGDALPGYTTLEGPKLYRRDGWYWIFAPAGGVATGWQSVFRSRDVFGPYEDRIVLEQDTTPINGPHQGAWVDTADGEDWFLHFQDRGPFGRVVHRQPLTWGDDGWPHIGEPLDADSDRGRPVLAPALPRAAARQQPSTPRSPGSSQSPDEPERSDDFATTALAPRWHWQANPAPGRLDLPGDGTLRLRVTANDDGDLRHVPQVLGQPLPGAGSVWTVPVTLGGDGPARAGIVALGRGYAWIGLERTSAGIDVVSGAALPDRDEAELVRMTAPGPRVVLRLTCDDQATITLAWRPEGATTWHDVPQVHPAHAGRWVGTEVGVFACAPRRHEGNEHTHRTDEAVFGPVLVTTADAEHRRI